MSAFPLHFSETLSKSPELFWRLFTAFLHWTHGAVCLGRAVACKNIYML